MNLLRHRIAWLRPKLPYLNIGLALVAYGANRFVFQVFCQPVPWAAWVLALSAGAFLVWPWLRQRAVWVQYLALFGQGVLLLVCGYCVWFFGWRTYLAACFFSFWWLFAPLLVWVPVFFGGQIVWRARRVQLPRASVAFGAGALLPLLAVGWAEYQFRQVEAAVTMLPPAQRQDIEALVRVVPRSFIAERLAGTQFKYHNYFCVYDGTRPALHDPLVNVCLWLRGGADSMVGPQLPKFEVNPLYLKGSFLGNSGGESIHSGSYENVLHEQQADVNRQATLYHRLFPAMPLNTGCACAASGGVIAVSAD